VPASFRCYRRDGFNATTTETNVTFTQLQALAAQLGDIRAGNLADRVDDVLDNARINADDTLRANPAENHSAIALATVGCLLSCSNDNEVCAWFQAQGITY